MVIEMSKPKKVVRKAKPKEPVEKELQEISAEDVGTLKGLVSEKEPDTPKEESTLDDCLLAYIKDLKGNFNIHKACVALEVEHADLVNQAWDRLFDKGLVPYMNIR